MTVEFAGALTDGEMEDAARAFLAVIDTSVPLCTSASTMKPGRDVDPSIPDTELAQLQANVMAHLAAVARFASMVTKTRVAYWTEVDWDEQLATLAPPDA